MWWRMPSKVYVSNYPAGDFRAMPADRRRACAAEVGHVVPWELLRVASRLLTGLVLLSDAEDGRLLAVFEDAAAVTAPPNCGGRCARS